MKFKAGDYIVSFSNPLDKGIIKNHTYGRYNVLWLYNNKTVLQDQSQSFIEDFYQLDLKSLNSRFIKELMGVKDEA